MPLRLPNPPSPLLSYLLGRVLTLTPSTSRSHLTAFSGGVDSTLTLALVSLCFPTTSSAVIGVSPSLSPSSLSLARSTASFLDVNLIEIQTNEGDNPEYIANKGMACYHCKTSLYTSLDLVSCLPSPLPLVYACSKKNYYNTYKPNPPTLPPPSLPGAPLHLQFPFPPPFPLQRHKLRRPN